MILLVDKFLINRLPLYGTRQPQRFDLFGSISSRDAAGFQKRRSKLNMRLNHGKNGSKMAPAAGTSEEFFFTSKHL